MTMSEVAIGYRLLRYQDHWEAVSVSGLTTTESGDLLLVGFPGLESGPPVQLPMPFDAEISGLAVDTHHTIYCSDTKVSGRVIISLCECRDEVSLQHPHGAGKRVDFNLPRGLMLLGTDLFVADSANGEVRVIDTKSFQLLAEWKIGLQQPAGLAADSTGRVYVLDIGLKRVLRFSPCGEADANFNATMAAHANLTAPFGLVVDANGLLYVTDSVANAIFTFDASGTALAPLLSPVAGAFKPRVLAIGGGRLYCADAQSGSIWAFDLSSRAWIGSLEAYRGPVSALAIDAGGDLLIKAGVDPSLHCLHVDAARFRSGSVLAGPFDAGEGATWGRVWLDADIPAEAEVQLELATSVNLAIAPNPPAWQNSASLDVLLKSLTGANEQRFIWVRITLLSHDGHATPLLRQAQFSTAVPSYLDHLPAIYGRDDAAGGFLERWLALFHSELGDWERELEELPRQFDARTVAAADLSALSNWLALDLPSRLNVAEQRKLLARAEALYRRRSTPAGLRDMAQIYAGADIHILEAFRERHLWQLGGSAQLGVDTALPAASPDGIIVPGFTFTNSALFGLHADYFSGTKFETLRYSTIDSTVNFSWGVTPPAVLQAAPGQPDADYFSIRWNGQIRSVYSEIYNIRTTSDDGVRLWVGGRPVIDNWTDHGSTEDVGQFRMDAGVWYAIVLEYYHKTGAAQIELRWSSPSQPLQVVPSDCLYPLFDESAQIAPDVHGGCETLEIGHAIVGVDRPLADDQYGAPLADDFAHLFTVVVPAAQVPLAAQRAALLELIEAEKPAHTDFRLCLVEPRMRVGVQARLGIDSIVAGGGPPMNLGSVALGGDSYLGGLGAMPPRIADAKSAPIGGPLS